MTRRNLSRFLIPVIFLAALIFPTGAAGSSLSGFAQPEPSGYPVTLTIGELSFEGTVGRMDQVSDEEMRQARQEALKETGLTELEIREAAAMVEKVARDEELTDEEIKEIWGNIIDLAGIPGVDEVTTAADVIGALLGEGEQTTGEIGLDVAGGMAQDEVLEHLLDEGSDPAGTILTGIGLSVDQYEKDQGKWRNRVAAANAKRLLSKFNEKLKEKLEKYRQSKGWVITIDDTDYRKFPFLGIEGNTETWTLQMNLRKMDNDGAAGPTGTYTGLVSIAITYDVSAFDSKFADVYFDNANLAEAESEGDLAITCSDEYTPSKVERNLSKVDYSVTLSIPAHGESRTWVDFSGFTDEKWTSVLHTVTCTAEDILWHAWYKSGSDGAVPESMTSDLGTQYGDWALPLSWDESIWKSWDQEKWLILNIP